MSVLSVILGSGGLVGLVVAAMAAIQLLMSWSEKRATAKVLVNVNASATFWKTWLEAHTAANLSTEQSIAAKQRAIEQLDNIAQAMDELINDSSPPALAPPIGWLRRLFVAYWPVNHSLGVWFWQVCFYGVLILVIVSWFFILFSVWEPQFLAFEAEEVAGPTAILNPPVLNILFPLGTPEFIMVFLSLVLTRIIVFDAENRAAAAAKRVKMRRAPVAVENLLRFLK